jgi:glycine/D-amino acid oxidase-like deaminating enzyme
MEKQSAEVDAVAGATVTSNAMLQAVQNCIDQAKGIAADDAVETEVTADVIVVGAGASGLAAASAVVEQGASVIVLEANSFLGGAAGTSMGNILYLDQEAFAQMDRNDAALAKYAGYTAEQFPEPWKSDYIKLMEQIDEGVEELDEAVQNTEMSENEKRAVYSRDVILGCMKSLRKHIDAAELLVGAKDWPYPTYSELLFSVM